VHCTSDLASGRPLASEPALEGIEDAVALAHGREFGCALTRGGAVRCWGDNTLGQLGAEARAERSERPLVVACLTGARAATTRGGRTWCWGSLVLPPGVASDGRPNEDAELAGFDVLTGSERAFCGTRRGDVLCFGNLAALATTTTSPPPRVVPIGVRGATKVRVGYGSACALVGDGTVVCWGSGSVGQLGRGPTTDPRAQPPEPVQGLPPAVDIAVGGTMACAVTAARDVYCWGSWPHVRGMRNVEPLPVKLQVAE